MMKKILTGLLILLVGVLAAIGQALYVPKAPNCEPASVVVAVATSGNEVFAKASLTSKDMYHLNWDTLDWTKLPLDTSLRFVTNPHEWLFIRGEKLQVVSLAPLNVYHVQVGSQDLNFCLPEE